MGLLDDIHSKSTQDKAEELFNKNVHDLERSLADGTGGLSSRITQTVGRGTTAVLKEAATFGQAQIDKFDAQRAERYKHATVSRFPLTDSNVPSVIFTNEYTGSSVALPIPAAVGVTEDANYSDVELGLVQHLNYNLQHSVRDHGGTISNQIAGEIKHELGNVMQSDYVAAVLKGVMGKSSDESRAASSMAYTKYNVKEFNNMGIRSYAFEYMLKPSSAAEAKAIKNIVEFFRDGVYPIEEGEIAVSFPPTFMIDFGILAGKIRTYTCYLTNCAVNYNGDGHSFFADNEPTSTKVSLTFSETQIVTKEEALSGSN